MKVNLFKKNRFFAFALAALLFGLSICEATTTSNGEIIADTFIDFENVANGTVVTPDILYKVTKGKTWNGWTINVGSSLSPGQSQYLTITSAARSPYPLPVSINGVSYSGGGSLGLRSVMGDNNIIQLNIPAPGYYQFSVGFFFRFNGAQVNWLPRNVVGLRSYPDGNYQFLNFYDYPQPFCHIHWKPFPSSTNGVGDPIDFNRGQWYWMTIKYGAANQTTQLNVYDPAANYALIGTSTGLVTGGTNGVSTVQFGTIQYASGASQSVDFDNIVLDTTGSFPLVPSTPTSDTTPPSIPTGLTASGVTSNSAILNWNASTDGTGGSGVADYQVFRGGSLVGSPTTTFFTDSGLQSRTTYSYTVKAVDRANNVSAASAPLSVTTAAPDTTAPVTSISSPANGATVSNTVSVTATGSDNVAVTKVEFYLDNTFVSATNTSPYSWNWNTATAVNGSHTLTTKAYDAAGNVGTSTAVGVTVSNVASNPSVAILQKNSNTTSGASKLTTAFASANKAGDLIVVAVSSYPAAPSATAITDTLNNTYTLVGPVTHTISGGYVAIYYAKNSKSGNNSVSFSDSTSSQKSMVIAEFSGLNATAPLDGAAGASGTGSVQISGTMVPTAVGDLVIGAGTHDRTDVTSPGAGFTTIAIATEDDASHQPLAMEYMVKGDSTPVATSFTTMQGSTWAQLGAAFKK